MTHYVIVKIHEMDQMDEYHRKDTTLAVTSSKDAAVKKACEYVEKILIEHIEERYGLIATGFKTEGLTYDSFHDGCYRIYADANRCGSENCFIRIDEYEDEEEA
jgi:hypothetical protein